MKKGKKIQKRLRKAQLRGNTSPEDMNLLEDSAAYIDKLEILKAVFDEMERLWRYIPEKENDKEGL
jgi:hypothetical protein